MIPKNRYFVPTEHDGFRLPERTGAGGTTYSRNIDFEFVLALAAIGHVRMTSNQVELRFVSGCSLKNLRLPENCVMEYAGAHRLNELPKGDAEGRIRFTFLPREESPA